ncbi:hypothetical protein BRADI_1g49805v3 [Brachypodium distachyon]|uniref:Bowman-Birk serine protease inhibitors family domain-containing protein n=1 Tax=Brachypodium distachyon TaxID=15368 RepID=A0A0Q3H9L4_BRADI|nr:hypothetical protein BRADI_1g49805v3 [Brachypodium distachyon]
MAGSGHLKVVVAAVCALLLAVAAAGQPAAEAMSCIERCGCVPCPEGKICTAVCTVPKACEDRCRCQDRCALLRCSAYCQDACKAKC